MMLKYWIKKSFVLGMSLTLLAPSFSLGYGEASVIQGYVGRQTLVPLIKPSWGNFILHTETLNQFYSQRGYQAVWVNSDGRPNAMAQTLKSALAAASERHGLNADDYWDNEVEGLFAAANTNQKNWITFELAASEALIRFATHVSNGRFDPEMVDTDIKFKKKPFTDYAELNSLVNGGTSALASGLDRFAPTHARYADMMRILAQLKEMKAKGGWATINSPGFQLKRGVTDASVGQLRARLNQLGYYVSNAGGNNFDSELENAVKRFQAANGLVADGIIGTRSEVLRALNFTVGQRIVQVEVNLEKLRWLPRNMENRHIFVNLATTEFRLFDDSGAKVFDFKTINGQPFRRTPSMRDLLTFVELNPTWTVPHSIAVKDKLPLIKKDPGYLDKHDMKLYDASTDEQVNPYSIDWGSVNSRNFSYYIRQSPGPDNALGVVKFPLQNPWAIYLHDTNDKHLFGEDKRHLSSGCVRLEYPLELAAYLLRDHKDGWNLDSIKAFVPMNRGERAVELQKKVTLTRAMPVYFLYLTVDRTDDGAIRFIDDVYGQDTRLSKALQNRKTGGELF